jgi:hypothetical protein
MGKTLLFLLFLVFFATSCEDILEVPDISNQQVKLLAPSQGSIVTDSVVSFNWNDIVEADAFIMQVATPNFESANQIVLDTTLIVDSTFVGTRISRKLPINDYEWRVKALNSVFETEFSTIGFRVDTLSN